MKNPKGKAKGINDKKPVKVQTKPKNNLFKKKKQLKNGKMTEVIKSEEVPKVVNSPNMKINKKQLKKKSSPNPTNVKIADTGVKVKLEDADTGVKVKLEDAGTKSARGKNQKNKKLQDTQKPLNGNNSQDNESNKIMLNTVIKLEEKETASESESKVLSGSDGKKPRVKMEAKKKSKRFVLFVGNLPYDVTEQDIHEHFKKAAVIKNVRLPMGEDRKPRGIAFIDLNNEEEYQKCLSMHNTFIGKRKINVLYTEGKNKNSNPDKKSKEKVKNLKLHAMSEKGLLKSSTMENRKRRARRIKKRIFEEQKKNEEEATIISNHSIK